MMQLMRDVLRRAAAASAVILGALVLATAPAAAAEGPRALEARIRGELHAFALSRSGAARDAIEIPDLSGFISGLDADALDTSGAEIRLSANSRNAWRGRVPVTVSVWSDGAQQRRGVVTLRIADRRVAWVAARDLDRGETIAAEDLRRAEVGASELPSDAVEGPSAAAGLTTRRSIAAGAPLRARWLERKPRVARGELVLIRLARGPLRIEARGKTRDAGGVGDRVRVQNVDSRRELMGRVAADGAIDVNF